MSKLVSEQLPNDGSYHIKRLVNEANSRLKQIGKQGKRATIVAKKSSLSLQFTFKDGNGRPQKNVGLGGISVSANGILEAERIAQLVTGQLVASTFTWDWFNKLIGKPASEQTKQLTCKEMVEQYKKHYFKQRKKNKNTESDWYLSCQAIEDIIGDLEVPMSLSLVRKIVESKENDTSVRTKAINGLVGFLKYFGNNDYKDIIKDYKANNNPKRKKRNVPTSEKIAEVYKNGFKPKLKSTKKYRYRYPQWQFLYGLLATYGLRIHEAWNIANWDKPVTLKNGDWVAVDVDDNNTIEVERSTGDLIVPAILDPSNKEYILCVKHATKTGYRMAMPLSPNGHNWIKEFNLLQPLNLPDIENPLEKTGTGKTSFTCSKYACQWFLNKGYGFTPHDLRHAFNHRGHESNYNPKALADSLGHSMAMNTTGYLRYMSDGEKLRGIKNALNKEQSKRSEIELLENKVKFLEFQLQTKDSEIELLRTKLQMYEAIKESKGKK